MRFVTIVNQNYARGLAALLQSMVENSGLSDISLILVLEEEIDAGSLALFKRLCRDVELHRLSDLGSVPELQKQKVARHTKALNKLLVFRLPHRGKLCYIDADMLCLSRLDGIENLLHFSAAPDRGLKDPSLVCGKPMFNTGFFVFEPSEAQAAELFSFYQSGSVVFDELGDQPVINHYFYERRPQEVNLIGSEWNTLKRRFLQPDKPALSEIKLLHYVGEKPWEPAAFMTIGDEYRFIPLYELWWRYYMRACHGIDDRLSEPNWLVLKSRAAAKRLIVRTKSAVKKMGLGAPTAN